MGKEKLSEKLSSEIAAACNQIASEETAYAKSQNDGATLNQHNALTIKNGVSEPLDLGLPRWRGDKRQYTPK